MNLIFSLLCAIFVPYLAAAAGGIFVVPPAKLSPSGYHRWAHYNWIWLHNGLSNQANVTALVEGYKANNIPVGAVNIDSMWATEFNNFEVNTNKFPDLKSLVQDLHDQSIRVILWATSMVNVENPDYAMCEAKQYLVRDSRGKVFPLHWWHGDGGLLDYTNPEAVKWWHSKMDNVLDMGVDGFKCDGTDPYIGEYLLTGGALGYQNQSISYRQYADSYYGDFFDYTREKRGDVGLIMSRPSDCMVDQVAKVCWGYSPKRVMYSGWVGDDDATFNGLRGCAKKVVYSAWGGYANFGCDIGGYRGEKELNKELFVRWAQYSAFLPLMENGGGGEHRPWLYDSETVQIYRSFAEEHHRLAPYLLQTGAKAMAAGVSSVTPLAERDPSVPYYKNPEPHTFNYLLGKDILVHPVMVDIPVNRTDATVVHASFPVLDSATAEFATEWVDWWKPHDISSVRAAGTKAILAVPLRSYSVFVRRGALLPLQRSAKDDTTMFTWIAPRNGEKATADSVEPAASGSGQVGTASLSSVDGVSDQVLVATISAHAGPAGFEVVGITEPSSVDVDAGAASKGCIHTYVGHTSTLTVYCASAEVGVKITAQAVKSTFTSTA